MSGTDVATWIVVLLAMLCTLGIVLYVIGETLRGGGRDDR